MSKSHVEADGESKGDHDVTSTEVRSAKNTTFPETQKLQKDCSRVDTPGIEPGTFHKAHSVNAKRKSYH